MEPAWANDRPIAAEAAPTKSSRRAICKFALPTLLAVLALPLAAQPATIETLHLDAPAFAPEQVEVAIHLPPGYDASGANAYPVLYLNDGQDAEAVELADALAQLHASHSIQPVIVVAIHMLPDRMGTYGLSDRGAGHAIVAQTKYGPVGARAHDYSEWVAHTLVPYIDANYRSNPTPAARAILGWSLGALNAFNLGWQYPEVFGRVGMFSPSLWISADRGDVESIQHTRLAQAMVDSSEARHGLRFFFAVGADEDSDDRDGDGINDPVDDAHDLIDGYTGPDGRHLRGLVDLGYRGAPIAGTRDVSSDTTRADIAYLSLPDGEHNQAAWARMLPHFLQWAYAPRAPALDATGRVDSWQDVPSAHVAPRNVDVWLPPGYDDDPARRYPVLYMHDGQNLFDPALSYTGVDWGVDEAMTRLITDGAVREAIVVGIWNTPRRFQEYMPRKPVSGDTLPSGVDGVPPLPTADIVSDAYLRFLVDELKPWIDATYLTRPERDDTLVMGSSMGGLISLYAAAEYPDVFGGVGALSTHWPVGEGIVVDWLGEHLPDPATHRLYFDHGTTTLDAGYAPYQQRMDQRLRDAGYVEGDNWSSRVFEGAAHNEAAWRARIDVPLRFLLGD
ncbi:alpha/beta hydrolase-fold protein [Lysobacter sp. F6437]|uniref:alpha/beta hydrolase-fold protein n=1 Tax=Lysobacter sp. F6437 TaxID=3459296 RepID=UPI00403DDC30